MIHVLRKLSVGVLSLAFLVTPLLAGNGDQVRQQKRDGSCGNCPAQCPQYGPGCQQGRGQGQGQGNGKCQRQRQGQCPNQGAQKGKPAPAQTPPAK